MRLIRVFLIFILGAACSQENSRFQGQEETNLEVSAPVAAPTPAEVPSLTATESEKLDYCLPIKAREIFERAGKIELFELRSCDETYPELEEFVPNKFHTCGIERKVDISEINLKKELAARLFYAIGSSGSGNACFAPKYGVRAEHERKKFL